MNVESFDKTPCRVLIVDDEESIRVALSRGLKRLGCDVIDAGDGDSGLNLAITQKPHVIFVDLRMNGIDGHTFLRRLRGQNIAASVIAMSGSGTMEDVVEVLRGGAIDYLKKPWEASELVAALLRAQEAYLAKGKSENAADGAATNAPGLSSGVAEDGAATELAGERLVAKVVARLRTGEIPVLTVPDVILNLRRLMQQPTVGADEVAAKIEQDPGLSADVLRLSNTAQYGRGGRNHSVHAAVTRIGFRQVHNLVETLFTKGLFVTPHAPTKAILQTVWKRSLARAMCMRAVADLLPANGFPSPDTAYVTGLFSDLGASFLLWVESQKSAPHPEPVPADLSVSPIIRANHDEMSASFLKIWTFDPAIVSAVRGHHAQTPPPDVHALWALIVVGSRLADSICDVTDLTASGLQAPMVVERATAELRVGDVALGRLADQLRADFVATLDVMGGGG